MTPEEPSSVDWDGFETDLAAYGAEKQVEHLVAGGARISRMLGIDFSPESFVLGAIFRDIGEGDEIDRQARLSLVKRLVRHARSIPIDDAA
jgi:hypothetical protein